MAEITEFPSLPPALRRAWGVDTVRPNRGPRASLSIDAIVDTAVSLGNTEGVNGISLTRVATRLGVTTNALYRYISSREELDVLTRERALGPPPPSSRARRWQPQVSAWAYSLRSRYAEQPWLVDLRIRIPLTPNALGWFERLLEGLARSPFTAIEKVRIATLVDGFVRSSAAAARDLAEAGPPLREPDPALTALGRLLADRGLTQTAEILDAGLYQEPPDRRNDADFAFGLQRIIAGLEALAASRRGSGA
ncbi:TetR/AcrR family transcriptional regulator [Dactylosporangium sp. CA-052675]|uniref:TetR/AcrR family transcriptional regulator n=1 Tax=Dactylosporangium sp. CA-052675 TaxID=3239927 RepID=UPI003D8CF666